MYKDWLNAVPATITQWIDQNVISNRWILDALLDRDKDTNNMHMDTMLLNIPHTLHMYPTHINSK